MDKNTLTLGQAARVSFSSAKTPRVDFGEIKVFFWNKHLRTKLATQKCGILWGLAALSSFLPVGHLYFTGFFLILSVLAVFCSLSKRVEILGGVGHCPACRAYIGIERAPFVFPQKMICKACHADVEMNLFK